MLLKKIMSRYFIIPFLFIGIMASDALSSGYAVENISTDNVWFTTRPPAARADIASATLIPFEGLNGYLRPGRTAYFNIYADFISAGVVKFYVLDKNGTQVECVLSGVTNGCISAIIKNSSPGFTLCINGDLLSAEGDYADTIFPGLDETALFSWRAFVVACSDSDTCEGNVIVSFYDYRDSSGSCWTAFGSSGRTGARTEPGLWNKGIGLKSPLYVRFASVPTWGGGDLDEIVRDFTIGFSITGTRYSNDER